MPFTIASAPRSFCTLEVNPGTDEFRSTGQPGFVTPVSTFNEKTKCFLVAPSIIASMKSDLEARSTAGVPLMPSGLMLPQGNPDVTAGPRLRCQMMLPLLASSAYTLLDSVTATTIGPFGPPSM